MAGRGSLVDAEAPATALLRARPRRREKRRRLSRARRGRRLVPAKSMSYVELHCHSAYSFGDGASAPEELAHRAAELGYESLAITDHDGVWGAMEFAEACKAFGVRPIVGAEMTITYPEASSHGARKATGDPSSARILPVPPGHLTLLVENADGGRNLCRWVTEAHKDTRPHPDREPLPPALPLGALEERAEGLVCLSGCA